MSAPQPVTLGVKIGFVLLGASLIACLFTWDWRWPVVGVVALGVAAVAGAPGRRTP